MGHGHRRASHRGPLGEGADWAFVGKVAALRPRLVTFNGASAPLARSRFLMVVAAWLPTAPTDGELQAAVHAALEPFTRFSSRMWRQPCADVSCGSSQPWITDRNRSRCFPQRA